MHRLSLGQLTAIGLTTPEIARAFEELVPHAEAGEGDEPRFGDIRADGARRYRR